MGAALALAVPCMGMVLDVNLKLRLIGLTGDAQSLSAAANHAALNVANAL